MEYAEIAGQCPKCGQWAALRTNDIGKAVLKCKIETCSTSSKLRGKFGPNINYQQPKVNQTLAELVISLNAPPKRGLKKWMS